MLYKLEQPDMKGIEVKDVFLKLFEKHNIQELIKKVNAYGPNETYLAWIDFKRKEHLVPEDFTKEEFWTAVKIMRKGAAQKTEMQNEEGHNFTWIKLPKLEKFFHEVDLNSGGTLMVEHPSEIDEKLKYKLLMRGIMEEAIASSQLEGANTTREYAKKFLREQRKPKNESENMILNNYLTMKKVEEEMKGKKLTFESLIDMHAMLTKDLVNTGKIERWRTEEDHIVVMDQASGIVYHTAPPMHFVEQEIKKLIAFANDESDEAFIHPVIKAIMLHFWIGYLHPFTDGNGRLARVLFYWYLLRKDYWAFSYYPISKAIRLSPVQYRNAYVFAEQDELDLTYFIDFHMQKIDVAIKDFESYVKEKAQKNKQMHATAVDKFKLNERQINLLQYLHKNEDGETSIKMHMHINQISRLTAIHDLKILKELGFVRSTKRSHAHYFSGTQQLETLFG